MLTKLAATLAILGCLATATAQTPPLPAKSTISIRETPSFIPAPTPKPGSKCKLAHKLVTFTPAIRLGADAQGGTIVWRFYVGIRNPEGRGIRLVSEKSFAPGEGVIVPPVVADAMEWQCSCCRPLNKNFPKLIGWYAELSSDGKVIAEAKPTTGASEMARLMVTKPEVPRSKSDGALAFTAGTENKTP